MVQDRVLRGREAIARYIGSSEDFIDCLVADPECPVEIVDGDFVADAENLLVWAICSERAAA
jgi:hypothetical protein